MEVSNKFVIQVLFYLINFVIQSTKSAPGFRFHLRHPETNHYVIGIFLLILPIFYVCYINKQFVYLTSEQILAFKQTLAHFGTCVAHNFM